MQIGFIGSASVRWRCSLRAFVHGAEESVMCDRGNEKLGWIHIYASFFRGKTDVARLLARTRRFFPPKTRPCSLLIPEVISPSLQRCVLFWASSYLFCLKNKINNNNIKYKHLYPSRIMSVLLFINLKCSLDII